MADFCRTCLSRLEEGVGFCTTCGTPVGGAAPSGDTKCADCGRDLRPGDRFCYVCGGAAVSATRPQSVEEPPEAPAPAEEPREREPITEWSLFEARMAAPIEAPEAPEPEPGRAEPLPLVDETVLFPPVEPGPPAATVDEQASLEGTKLVPALRRRTQKRGLAGIIRTRPWWIGILVIVFLLPFWLTSEIRQSTMSTGNKLASVLFVWIFVLGGVAAAAEVASRDATTVSASPTPVATPTTTPVATQQFAATPAGWPQPPPNAQEAFVAAVTDGDTIILRGIDVGSADTATGGRNTRLIGMDAPEGGACFGPEATAFTRSELDQKSVLVDYDVQNVDDFGRALVYVWTADGVLFNARLGADGYGQQQTVPPNTRYSDLFTTVTREARLDNKGLWSRCQTESPLPSPGATAAAFADRNCSDFATQPDAQRFFEEQGGPGTDPHSLDTDGDGIACEGLQGETQAQGSTPPPDAGGPPGATGQTSTTSSCHPSYPDFCVNAPPPDLDCGDLNRNDFTVRHDVSNPDPHGLDPDGDGVGCETG